MFFQKAWQFFYKHGVGASGGCYSGVWTNTTPCGVSCISNSSDPLSPSPFEIGRPASYSGLENQLQSHLDNKNGISQGHSTIPMAPNLVKSLVSKDTRKTHSFNDATLGTGIFNECLRKTTGLWPTGYWPVAGSAHLATSANLSLKNNLLSHVVENRKALPEPIQLSSKVEEIVLSSDEEDLLPNIAEKEPLSSKTESKTLGDDTITSNSTRQGCTSLGSANAKLEKRKLGSTNIRIEVQQMMAGTKLVEQLHSEALNEEAISILRGSNPGPENLLIALKYLKKSVELGNSKAMFNLAVCFETGKFGEHNYMEALALYEKAWLNGNEKAGHNFKLLKQDMLKLRANKLGKQD